MKVYCEEKKEGLSVTLSVKICQNDNSGILDLIKNLQKEIIDYIPVQPRIQTYLYPENTIHFSLLNFCSFELDIDFKDARKTIELQKWYSGFLRYAEKEIINNLPNTKFRIKKFYKPNDIKGSIALNLENNDKEWWNKLENIENKVKKKLETLKIPIKGFGIKKTPEDFFVVNLLRFLGDEHSFIGNCDDLGKFLDNKNKSFETKTYNFEVKNSIIVISDPYLSNENPQILPKSYF